VHDTEPQARSRGAQPRPLDDGGLTLMHRLPRYDPATQLVRMFNPFRDLMLSAAVAAVVAGAPSPGAAQIQLDVMTFNIRTSLIPDGENGWEYRKELVAKTIRDFAPDVIGMQEAITEQIDYLSSSLPEYRWLGIDRRLNGGQGLSEHTPIFYRHDELAPIESGNFWLTDTPDRPPAPSNGTRRRGRGGGRIVTWARFHHLATGRAVYVFNTHLSLRRGQGQIDSINLILERIGALPNDAAVIALGDFNNSGEYSELWRTATGHGLADAWVIADERRGPPLTYGDFSAPDEASVDRVDWILVGGPISVLSAETVLYNVEGRYPSDHYPVVARLEIR
jgi:endonuclease/exonuclease/phosphatase family metal-dependent hydrolase